MRSTGSRRMKRVSAGLTSAEVVTVVRRLGYVAAKMHQTMMSNLVASGNESVAEAFNDAFKPVVDWLLHFELEAVDASQEPNDETD